MRQQHRTLHETLEATPKAVREARQLLVDFTRRCCPHSQQTVDGVALTVSEAVGNVVRHAYLDQTGTVEICASIEQESLIITISDHGVGRATPSPNRGQGLGLTLATYRRRPSTRPPKWRRPHRVALPVYMRSHRSLAPSLSPHLTAFQPGTSTAAPATRPPRCATPSGVNLPGAADRDDRSPGWKRCEFGEELHGRDQLSVWIAALLCHVHGRRRRASNGCDRSRLGIRRDAGEIGGGRPGVGELDSVRSTRWKDAHE